MEKIEKNNVKNLHRIFYPLNLIIQKIDQINAIKNKK